MKSINRKKRLASQSNDDKSLLQIVKYCSIFTLFFFISSFLILLFVSLFLFNTSDPSKYLGIASKAILYSSVFACSIALTKKLKQSYLLSGLIFGCMIDALFFIISLIYGGDRMLAWYILIPIFSILGGLLGIKKESKPRKRRHR